MRKDPDQRKCEWCDKPFETVRKARFCCDRCRSRWHRQKELDDNMVVYNRLRSALGYCLEMHPELTEVVNGMLSDDDSVPSNDSSDDGHEKA